MSAPIPNAVSLPSLYNLRTRILTHLALAVAAAAQKLQSVVSGETEVAAPDLRAALALLKLAPKILSELPSDPSCDKPADYEPLPAPAAPTTSSPTNSDSDSASSEVPPVSSPADAVTTDLSPKTPPTPSAVSRPAKPPTPQPVPNTPPAPKLSGACRFCGQVHPFGPCHPGARTARIV